MDRILDFVLRKILDDNDKKTIIFLIFELLDTLKDCYCYDKIQKRVLELLVNLEGEHRHILDVNKEECINTIGRLFPHVIRDSIELISFNNITMEVRFSYSTEGYDCKSISTISAFNYPEILYRSNN